MLQTNWNAGNPFGFHFQASGDNSTISFLGECVQKIFTTHVCLRGRVDTVVRRLISCTMSLAGPGSIPVVGKLVITSRQLGGHCQILRILNTFGGKMAGVWTRLLLAQNTMRRFPVVRTGVF